MTGTSFCGSAKDAFDLIWRNIARFNIVGGIGEVFTAVGQIFLCLITALIGYAIITKSSKYNTISDPMPSTVIFGIIGFVIGAFFMSVYGTVADATLIIFTMEEEIEKYHGKTQKSNKCPEPLKEFIDTNA